MFSQFSCEYLSFLWQSKAHLLPLDLQLHILLAHLVTQLDVPFSSTSSGMGSKVLIIGHILPFFINVVPPESIAEGSSDWYGK